LCLVTGDSTYPTYLKNPTTIDQGLTAAGATRIGDLGKGDAHQIGDKAQDKVIARWIDDLWLPLAKTIADTDENVNVKQMQAKSIPVLLEIDPDIFPSTSSQGGVPILFLFIGILAAILAALVGSGILKLP